MTTTDERRRRAAKAFVERWTFRRGSEKGEDQQFWNDLLRSVLGVEDVEARIRYQVPVPMGGGAVPATARTTKFLDAWIPETRVLIEHKSRGVDLSAPQSGHGGLTPYEQACEYDNARPFDEKARWIVTCNFDRFEIHDRAKPLAPPLVLRLRDLPKEVHRLAFLVDPKEKAIDRELEISVQAGRIVGELYDALLKRYAGKVNSDASDGSATASPIQNAGTAVSQKQNVSGASDKSEFPPDALAALNRLCVRLVFCLYAEDAGVFPKDCLRRLVEATPAEFLRTRLAQLFRVLDTPPERRDPYLEPELAAFPYTNGGLFRMRSGDGSAAKNAEGAKENPTPPRGLDDIPPLTEEIRQLLLGACRFDWREITPTIFGALFESTLNPETRRAGGMVYTSVGNIHKVIGPLFLDGLTRRVDEAVGRGATCCDHVDGRDALRRVRPAGGGREIDDLQAELASLTFLDPACGSGNFLTETFICLRRLENRLIAERQRGQGELDLGLTVKVSLAQFRGIEINDFAVAVAKTALWIAEAQMRRETAEILHREPDYLPLRDAGGIVEGNALRVDWPRADFIMGNPPFVGASMMTAAQKAEAVALFGKGRRTNSIDYVGAWYHRAAALMAGTPARAAFVSTNSITQGEQVAPLWRPLFERYGLVIDFAWRTFRWDSEASEKAHVHCVIVGFHAGGAMNSDEADGSATALPVWNAETDVSPKRNVSGASDKSELKTIFGADGAPRAAANICPYLIDAPTVFVESRGTPLCDVPAMTYGCKPSDGGNLILTGAERDALLADEGRPLFIKSGPTLADCIRHYVGARDFINNDEVRYCLWLKDVSPAVYRRSKEVMRRLAAVREMRLKSTAAPTRKMAERPYLFFSTPPLGENYLAIPEVSTQRRDYIPIGYLPSNIIPSNKLCVLPHSTLYHFGILTSSVHMAWMRAVAGRMKSDYSYSPAVVYNNFPWPEGTGGTQFIASVGCGRNKLRPSPLRPSNPVNPVNPVKESPCLRPSAISALSAVGHEAQIAATAQGILDARVRDPDASLADLYDPLTMPPDLRAAHAANDRAVLAAYGLAPDTPEAGIVAHLFRLYAEKAKS